MLEIIITAIILSTIINIFFKRYHIPTIIGYISTGFILSYLFGLHDVVNDHNLNTFAEFGIVFLMFTIGLEFSVKKLFKMKYEVFINGGLQVFCTGAFIYILSYFIFGIDFKSSFVIACGLSLSSTAIVLKTLNDNREINKKYGQKSLGILLFQDLAVIPILLIISLLASSGESFGFLMLKAFLSGILLVSLLLFAGKYLLDPFLKKVYKTKANDIFIGAIFSIVLGSSYIAHYLGLSYSLGALIAGVLIAETHYKHQIEADLLPFRDLLLGVFFITVGMQLKLFFIFTNLYIIIPLLVGIIIIKIMIIYFISLKSSTKHTSIKTALSLFQVGEFGIVIFKLASASFLISDNISQILITVTILSMILTPFILRNLEFITRLITKEEKKASIEQKEELDDHIVLVGYGRLGKTISGLLDKHNMEHIIIESYPKMVELAKKEGKNIILGDASNKHILKSLHIKRAKSVIVSVGNNEKLYHICHAISEEVTKGKIIVKANKYEEKEMLQKLNLGHIIVETEATALGMFHEIPKNT